MKLNRIMLLVIGGVTLIVGVLLAGNLFEDQSANERMVIQYMNGSMDVFDNAGPKAQWFGRVTKYPKRGNFAFLLPKEGDAERTLDNAIPARFNDGGHGRISGTVAFEYPADRATFLRLHTLYGSSQAVEKQLVQPVVTKAIYMTGPLMSSKESNAERRNDLLNYIDDQIAHGVYRTRTFQRRQVDELSGEERTVQVVELVRDSGGVVLRQDKSPLAEFGIRTFNLAIERIPYDEAVEKQIKAQQEMTMAVQTAIAEARKAEQSAITAEQNGKAEAAKAKWAQEVIKAQAVTEAEQKLEVAAKDALAAEQEKRANILRGEGEAARKRAVMAADGALDKKIEALTLINARYAQAISSYTGAWVPQVVMGSGSANGVNGASTLIDMLTAKTARDLGLDLSIPKGAGK